MQAITRRELLLLAAITLLAFAVRLYQLDLLPPGLHHDEALNGLNAQNLLRTGERPIYIGSKFNGEPLLEYSLMLSESLFGMTPFAVRFPAAIYGALTIPVVFFLVKALGQLTAVWRTLFSGRAALLASLLMATLYWHVNASREGYKPVFLPLFGALALWLLVEAIRPGISPSAQPSRTGREEPAPRFSFPATRIAQLACGIVLGFGFYTYPSIRFLYPVVALFILYVMWRERTHARMLFMRVLPIAVIALLVFAPLAIYYVQHPSAFFTRADQVSVWATQPGHIGEAVAANALKVAGMFFVQGDENPRHNLPDRPAFDGFLAVGFVLGLLMALRYWKEPVYFLLLLWLLAMIIPSVVTDAAPNFLRTLGATVPATVLAAMGLERVWQALEQTAVRRLPPAARFGISNIGFGILLLVSSALSLNAYFVQMPANPQTWFAFDVGLVKIAEVVRSLPPDEPVYLTPISTEQATIQFVLGGPRANFKDFDGRHCLVAPLPGRPTAVLVVSEDYRSMNGLQWYWPQGRITQQIADFADNNYLTVYQLPLEPWNLAPRTPAQHIFGGQAVLAGYTILADRVEAGQGIPLQLFWKALQPMQTNYTVFTHLIGAMNPRTKTPLWGQHDGQPCEGGYPTTRWGPGETVAEDFLIVVDKDAPAGVYSIDLGVYELSNGRRLTLPDATDSVTIGPVEIFRK